MAPNESDWLDIGLDAAIASLRPKYAGQTETVTVTLTELQENATLFIGLRAVDESGNAGEVSNVVTLSRARELAVPMETMAPDLGVDFYLKLIIPPVAAVVIFAAIVAAVMLSRRGASSKGSTASSMDSLEGKDTCLSASTFSLDVAHLSHMNYRNDGQYRQRCQEDPETWSELGKSRESLDII